jgi:hypothetical protein
VRELARRAAGGEVPFLAGRRFVWIAAATVGPEDSWSERPFRLERGIDIARKVTSHLQQPFTRGMEARFREIALESRRVECVKGTLAQVG